jgi:biopolymer transport protein ExbD
MDKAFGGQSRRRKPAINVTPLIDVMFLLIIFFMVSSTFREQLGIQIDLPHAETAAQQERPPHEIAVRADGSYFLGQRLVTVEELRQGLSALLQEDPQTSFVLRADERAAFQQVLTAIDIARAVGGNRLVIPSRPLEQP